MTIAAYQTLYESSVAFGMRKALQAEQGKADMEKRVGLYFLVFIIVFQQVSVIHDSTVNENTREANLILIFSMSCLNLIPAQTLFLLLLKPYTVLHVEPQTNTTDAHITCFDKEIRTHYVEPQG